MNIRLRLRFRFRLPIALACMCFCTEQCDSCALEVVTVSFMATVPREQ